jgi:hypothetical protein
MGAPKDDKPTGSPTVVGLETVVMSSIICAISYLILHLDNFTMRDTRAPIGAVKHHGLSCAELTVNSHGATASPVMATNPSSEGGVRLDHTASVDKSITTRSLGPPIASRVADVAKYDSVNVTELASALAGLRVAAAARPIFEGPSRKGLELGQRCTA